MPVGSLALVFLGRLFLLLLLLLLLLKFGGSDTRGTAIGIGWVETALVQEGVASATAHGIGLVKRVDDLLGVANVAVASSH